MKPAELMEVGGTAMMVGVLGVAFPLFAGWGLLRPVAALFSRIAFCGSCPNRYQRRNYRTSAHFKGLLNRTASKIILAAAVVDDILALLVLGVISSMASDQ